MDVCHGYGLDSTTTTTDGSNKLLLECVDLCVDEGKRIVILGSSACGKSTLLRLLAKVEQPLEGNVHHALNATVGLLDQHTAEKLMEFAKRDVRMTALSYLALRFPQKTEQELRVELTAFGLGPKQVSTSVQFLSGGERSRLCFAALMLEDPHVLLLDTPTSHLDVESVEALVQGLNQWNGTLVIASHDAYLIRSIEGAECYVIQDSKLFRLRDGFDRYLRTFRV
jgi:ATP-binding cassette subfamily F protein 3